jgi:arylsulfatase A-like enzyme
VSQIILRLCLLGLPLTLVPGASADGPAPRRPNVVFLLADDLGWKDTSAYGSTFYETPHVERLARRGMRFTNAYAANPLCSPTRASILTGQFPARVGITVPNGHIRDEVLTPSLPERAQPQHKAITPIPRNRLPLEHVTLAETLKAAGYATGHFGKWHLGWEPYHPQNQGFDVAVPGGSYPGPPGSYFSPFKAPIYVDARPGQHIEDLTSQAAAAWIKAHKDEPFYLNYWLFSVHAPHDGAKPESLEKYRRKANPAHPQRNPINGAMVEAMDTAIGRVLDTLDELGLTNQTIIIFTSDNGGISWQDVEGAPVTSNAPLRNGKASIHEGGTREPAIVVWPGKVKEGSVSDSLIMSIDYYPTILEMLNLPRPSGQVLDGVSLIPVLTGSGPLSREALFCHFPHYTPASSNLPATWVRRGDWKLIRFYADGPGQTDRFELYNLRDDLGETTNLADRQPELVRELNALIDQHLKDTGALVPKPNPAYRAVATTAGWQGNPKVTLTLEAEGLVITATGDDPFLTTTDLPARLTGPIVAELTMSSTGRGPGQLYWSLAGARPFHRDRSAVFAIQHDGMPHTYRVPIPARERLLGLRLDPGTSPGTIRLESLRLLRDDRTEVKVWRFERPPGGGHEAGPAPGGAVRDES